MAIIEDALSDRTQILQFSLISPIFPTPLFRVSVALLPRSQLFLIVKKIYIIFTSLAKVRKENTNLEVYTFQKIKKNQPGLRTVPGTQKKLSRSSLNE